MVRWAPAPRGEEVLVSGGVDKCVRVWKEKDGVVWICVNWKGRLIVVWFEADDYGSYWVGELYCCAGRSVGDWIF